jgi:hypothetical protein
VNWLTTDRKVHFLHHLIGAVMLFSILHFAEHKHMLAWLDAAMIRVAGMGHAAAPAQSAKDRPSIVMIERDAFETVFDDRSPLPRDRLVELLAQFDARRTGVLAIDIDLAPTVTERAAGGMRPLDTVLADLAARGVVVVLGLPPPAATAPGATLAWVRARCADGIRFGDVALHQRLGVVSRVRGGAPTLARVAYQAAAPRHAADHHAASAICALAQRATGEAAFFDGVAHAGANEHGAAAAAESTPLSSVASNWATLRSDTHAVQLRGNQAVINDAGQLRKVVFLGGAYDDGERMLTVGGAAYGVQVHAASFTSLAMGTADASVWVVAASDILLGLLFGFLFHWMWERFSKLEHTVGAWQCTRAWVLHFYFVRLVLFGCWMLPLALAYISIVASSSIYAHGLWINPGPIIIGMFLHTLSLRSEASEAAHGDHAAPAAHSGVLARLRAPFALLLKHHPGSVLVQLPLTVILLILAMQH